MTEDDFGPEYMEHVVSVINHNRPGHEVLLVRNGKYCTEGGCFLDLDYVHDTIVKKLKAKPDFSCPGV
jgi:hypothetical protein